MSAAPKHETPSLAPASVFTSKQNIRHSDGVNDNMITGVYAKAEGDRRAGALPELTPGGPKGKGENVEE